MENKIRFTYNKNNKDGILSISIHANDNWVGSFNASSIARLNSISDISMKVFLLACLLFSRGYDKDDGIVLYDKLRNYKVKGFENIK